MLVSSGVKISLNVKMSDSVVAALLNLDWDMVYSGSNEPEQQEAMLAAPDAKMSVNVKRQPSW